MVLINKFKVSLSSNFKEELKNIIYYIKVNLKKPLIAEKFYNNVINKISSLNFMPERYPKIQNFRAENRNIRRMPIKEYLIIYQVNKDTRTSFYFTYFSL